MTQFNYEEAFSRNLGWVTEEEQQILRGKKVAIAGLGGVGGVHLLTLVRLGVSQFHIADNDTFEVANFNRQVGAMMSTVGRPKIDVLTEMALDINPELQITKFDQGVSDDNVGDFLQDVDLYIDGLDFFVLDIRQKVFARCYELGIPTITAAPMGMGTALLTFMPEKMSFEQYFRFKGYSPAQQQVLFIIGLTPSFLHNSYMDKRYVSFFDKKGPSTPMACELCAGATGTEALKILLKRGKLQCAPWGYHFDVYKNKFKKTWRPWGNNNPIQKIAFYIACKLLLKKH